MRQNGQALIKALNGGVGTQLGDCLAATFANMYGTTAGVASLGGHPNAQVAAFFRGRFLLRVSKVDAQVLSTALSAYVTRTTLDSTAVAPKHGFTVSGFGVGPAGLFNVGQYGSALGLPNGATVTVLDLLLLVNAQAVNGKLFGGTSIKRIAAEIVFGLINGAGNRRPPAAARHGRVPERIASHGPVVVNPEVVSGWRSFRGEMAPDAPRTTSLASAA